jgi:RNA polymerase sigma factor (TIGR02999 family)
LVHEAWLRLGNGANFENRAHFFSAAAEAMRRILVESARRKQRVKHGGELERADLSEVEIASPTPDHDLLALDEVLDRLTEVDPRASEVVKLCYFVGLSQEAAAEELALSISTVKRLWTFARSWLYREIVRARNAPT